ncbi:hypothetical protein COLO4_32740 [Corchorus olitorius]|uniref:Uncharacterized protein n=1 Tax=Corchorus olitorius TaxID=93759 RepID=A0A1R3GYH0_9ROSI|nr:hypothetical protein COLO4_32740 [Corchorus olitorius]
MVDSVSRDVGHRQNNDKEYIDGTVVFDEIRNRKGKWVAGESSKSISEKEEFNMSKPIGSQVSYSHYDESKRVVAEEKVIFDEKNGIDEDNRLGRETTIGFLLKEIYKDRGNDEEVCAKEVGTTTVADTRIDEKRGCKMLFEVVNKKLIVCTQKSDVDKSADVSYFVEFSPEDEIDTYEILGGKCCRTNAEWRVGKTFQGVPKFTT